MTSLQALLARLLVPALLCLAIPACLTPPVVLAGDSLPLEKALAVFPEPCEAVELAAVDGSTLRGVFVPAEEGAAVVLHLLGATDSCGSPKYSQRPHVAQLRDLGLASLILDYRGVGLSRGERSPEHLADDAWVLWQEALRRAGGDAKRVGIRATSLGTIATAQLLERGAEPGAITLIAPVLPRTVVQRYARVEHGWLLAGLARILFEPVAEVDVLARFAGYSGPLLVCASKTDAFISGAERASLERMVFERKSGAWFGTQGGHYRSSLAARVLFTREKSFWAEALPPTRPAPTPEEFWSERAELAAAFQGEGAARERLARLLALQRHGDAKLLAAAALALPDPFQARELVWSLEQRPLPELSLADLREVLSLADPAGALPFELLLSCARQVDELERLSLPRFFNDSSWLARCVQAIDRGTASVSITYQSGGEQANLTLSYTDLWNELLERGLSTEEARRVLLRILLRTERIPERVRPDSAGFCGLEVYEDGAWRPLVAERGRLQFGLLPSASRQHPPPPAAHEP